LIQIDEDPAEIGREYQCDLGIIGDLRSSLQVLTDQIEASKDDWDHVLPSIREEFATQSRLPILPELRRVLPEDAIVAVDVHSIGYASFTEFPVAHPQTFLYPCIGVTLGYAFPAAIGAKIANPDTPVVCFTGDGGFMMGVSELATAMMYGVNVVTIVVNDGALTAIKGSQQKGCDGRTIDTDLYNPDFIQFAKSFGAYATRVNDLVNFEGILKEALASNSPAVIEVPMQDKQDNLIDIIGWLQSEPLRKAKF
jgi:acetolactate synthase-1/2/3 large subunit